MYTEREREGVNVCEIAPAHYLTRKKNEKFCLLAYKAV
jgi:hypothetical protein